MPEVAEFTRPRSTLADTPTSQAISGLLALCHDRGGVGMISGPAGIGKTHTIKHYCANNPGAWTCEMNPAVAKPYPGLLHIYREFGNEVPWARGHWDAFELVKKMIVDDLWRVAKDTGRRPLLVIDEVQWATVALVDTLRWFHDQGHIGLVVAGNHLLRARLHSRQEREQFAPLKSRAYGAILELGKSSPKDVAALCSHHGVEGARSHAALTEDAVEDGVRAADRRIARAREIAGPGNRIEFRHIELAGQP